MRLILDRFKILNSNDAIAKNIMSEMDPLFNARYGAIVDFTDPTSPLLDISTDEWTSQLIVDLSSSQWIVDDKAKFAEENIVQPNYVRLFLLDHPIIKEPDSVLTLRSGASYTYSQWETEFISNQKSFV